MINRRLGYIARYQEPLLMGPSDTVQQACNAMREKHVGSVLVVDEHERLLGIFTGRDGLRLLASGKACDTPLAEAMTRSPVTVSPEQKAIDALRVMSDGDFRHVPVIERGRIVGIVSRSDFKGEELELLEQDEALAERIW